VTRFCTLIGISAVIAFTLTTGAGTARAAVVSSVDTLAAFPSSAEFQTFNPNNAATTPTVERTVREDAALATGTRILNQSFQLGSDLTIGEIDILFVRGVSGNQGLLRIFEVADTRADDFTADAANPSLLNITFTMPDGLIPTDNTQQTLRLQLTGADQITLPARTGPAGYIFSLSSTVDADTAANREVFTWRMGEGLDGANNTERLNNSFYVPGRIAYDDYNGAVNSERRRDGVFALVAVPEPSMLALVGLGGLALVRRPRGA
jgi:hypothetical protein